MKLGIDIGGSHIGFALIENEEIKKKEELEIERNNISKEYLLKLVEDYITAFSSNNYIDEIGIVAPGTPIKDSLKMKNIFNLGIDEICFRYLEEKYNIPIKINNDAKAAAIAEYKKGALKEYSDAVFLCLGTGIGSAVFLDEKLLEASKHTGFELGHMIIDKNGLECNCGKKGCFETYCSIKRFKNNAKKILDIEEISSDKLLKEIELNVNNYNIENLVNEYIDNMIFGLSNIIDIFEPEAICLGGSFVYFKNIFFDRLVNEMNKQRYYFNKDRDIKLVLAELKNDAGLLGAVL